MELAYDYPLYRPPSEANSLIFQVTLGCSFNKCSFCDMYRTKEYAERPWEEIKSEIDLMARLYPDSARIFLADGDALNMSKDRLVQILQYLYHKFPKIERVSCYAMPKNLLQKTDAELAELRKAGLHMFYVGIESGNDVVLKKVTKGATGKSIVQACNKAKKHGYVLSCMIILGLGGKKYSQEHIADTARVLSEVAPDYVGALTLHLDPSLHDEFMSKYAEPFEFIDDMEVLDELERLIHDFNPAAPVVFRANHASNVYSVKGTMPADREKMLELVKKLKSHPEMLKPKFMRGF
ncbi:MAG: radical SAM protein [Nitrososphaera sp.]|uniref:radical SAM protein n=1 Tax=Nitrososphaera sp. TaxID=1971748 RepID=UPI001821CF89|nr:radical SAM protein [Nitrososphaera sp.]NWG37649.1 radical SAM protein [Nitrososphaera sp.]